MRFSSSLAMTLALVFLTGCTSTRWGWLKPSSKEEKTKVLVGAPSIDSLVQYMNANASRVKSLRVDELDITAGSGLQNFNMRGKMAIEKPKSFRLAADALGKSMADLGSNDEEFWFWLGKAPSGQPPYQFYCSHQDWSGGKVSKFNMPFQPEWITEVLGLGTYGPAERYEISADRDHLRLTERTRTAQGQPVRKVIVMKRRETRSPEPQVTQFLLLEDGSEKEIASANITETVVDPGTGAILPKRVELRWREADMRLKLILSNVTVNPQIPAQAFVRPLLDGMSFNLARGQVDPPGFQQTRGIAPPVSGR